MIILSFLRYGEVAYGSASKAVLKWTNIDHNRHNGQTSTITDSITNYAHSDEVQATKDSKLKLFAFSTKSTNITAKYTQTDRKKTKRSDTQ
jgi:hypothetical protein